MNKMNRANYNKQKRPNQRRRANRKRKTAPRPSPNNIATAPVAQNRSVVNYRVTRDVTVSHKELMTKVYGTRNYDVSYVTLNPGISLFFPWLSGIAAIYDKYEFIDLRFVYNQTSASTTPGYVAMAVDYDMYDPAPTDKQQFMSMDEAASFAVWRDCAMPIAKSRLKNRGSLFTSQTEYTPSDRKSYHLGKLWIATETPTANGSYLGDIYVQYTVKFTMPQPNLEVASSLFYSDTITTGTAIRIFGDTVPSDRSTLPISSFVNALYPDNQYHGVINITMAGNYVLCGYVAGAGLGDLTLAFAPGTPAVCNLNLIAISNSNAETIFVYSVKTTTYNVQVSFTYTLIGAIDTAYVSLARINNAVEPIA